jgi:hypothetical protein
MAEERVSEELKVSKNINKKRAPQNIPEDDCGGKGGRGVGGGS